VFCSGSRRSSTPGPSARDRRDLAELDERQRRDMGLDLDAIRREASKPFWRA
jgi:uncharacterized protein YjiS (DUF1127 family)